jgi:hypothetical protein
VFGGLLVFVLGLTGCGGASPEALVKDRIKAMNALAEAYKTKDDAKIKDAEKKVDGIDSQLAKADKTAIAKAVTDNIGDWGGSITNAAKEAALASKKVPDSIMKPAWAPGP